MGIMIPIFGGPRQFDFGQLLDQFGHKDAQNDKERTVTLQKCHNRPQSKTWQVKFAMFALVELSESFACVSGSVILV